MAAEEKAVIIEWQSQAASAPAAFLEREVTVKMDFTEHRVNSRTAYEGIIVNVCRDTVQLHNGKEAQREVVEHPGGVAIFALDDFHRVVMVKQFRYAVGKTLWEIPAGKLEWGEEPRSCALRELREETGLRARQVQDLGYFHSSPGIMQEKLHLFFVRELEEGEPEPDEDEFVEIARVDFHELLNMIERGEVQDAKTLAATLKVAQLLHREGTL